MYKFTNGLVAYDKETAESMIKNGFTLVKPKEEIINAKVKENVKENSESRDVELEYRKFTKGTKRNK